MSPILTVVDPASDPKLLSAEEMRAAVGVRDSSKDAELATLNARLSAAIARACRVAQAGTAVPTLRRETLEETYRFKSSQDKLVLSRFPVESILSVTENDVSLDPDYDLEIDASTGFVYRLNNDHRVCWPCGKVVLRYKAGWGDVPDDLKLAASKFALILYSESTRDPALKSIQIEGVSRREYWVGPQSDPLIPAEIMDLLRAGGYINTWL